MSSIHLVAQLCLLAGAVACAALLMRPAAERLDLPAPVAVLGGGIAFGLAWPHAADALTPQVLAELGTAILVVILADGGLQGRWGRVRRELGPISVLAFGGTAATFALVALVVHVLLGEPWPLALLAGAILAPTDPVAVFSLRAGPGLASRRIPVVLEAEAGLNDPVAIALTLPLLDAAAKGTTASVGGVVSELLVEGVVGAAVGIAAARLLGRLVGQDQAPRISVAPALTILAGAFVTFGAATLLHGSGFLAAYLYGLLLGDRQDLPERRVVAGLHAQLSSLGEIAMFALLGVALARVDLSPEWGDALLLAVALTLVIRPLVAYPPLRLFGFTRAEAAVAAWGGLKGAVPILLATLAYAGTLDAGPRLFALTGLVVLISLLAQGATLGRLAARLGLVPAQSGEDEPTEPAPPDGLDAMGPASAASRPPRARRT